MAEVCLTLIDPEIYGGPDTNAPTEIEIQTNCRRRESMATKTGMKRRFAPCRSRNGARGRGSSTGKTEELEGEPEPKPRRSPERRDTSYRRAVAVAGRRWF